MDINMASVPLPCKRERFQIDSGVNQVSTLFNPVGLAVFKN